MTVDNFLLINDYLKFDNSDDFYFVQIIQRRKENPDIQRNARIIRNYYLSEGELMLLKPSIVDNCKRYNARAYIRLNKRNKESLAYKMNARLAEYLQTKQYSSVQNLFDKVCGEYHSDKSKKWVVDIDSTDQDYFNKIFSIICGLEFGVYGFIPTVNGKHIITSPFDIKKFNQICMIEKVEIPSIHKDNPTLLFYTND